MTNQPQPPLVIECPECGEKYLLSATTNLLSDRAIHYSDGYFYDETTWRTPRIIGCVTCDLGFFPEKGKLIAQPNWQEFNENWSHLKKAEPPTAGSLALELRARKNMSVNEEFALRLEYWYAGNHTETGRLLMEKNAKFKAFWEQSRITLEQLANKENPLQLIVKAELNRQIGNFDACIELLKDQQSYEAVLIYEQALKANSNLFVLKQA